MLFLPTSKNGQHAVIADSNAPFAIIAPRNSSGRKVDRGLHDRHLMSGQSSVGPGDVEFALESRARALGSTSCQKQDRQRLILKKIRLQAGMGTYHWNC